MGYLSISRRNALQLVMALTLACRQAAAETHDRLRELIGLATNPRLLSLAPEDILQQLAFLGAAARKQEDSSATVYWLKDGVRTRGLISFSKIGSGWHLDEMTLLFGVSHKIPFIPLREAFTNHFGEPTDITMSPQSNTQLLWRGADRSVDITADVPAISPKEVFVITVKRLR